MHSAEWLRLLNLVSMIGMDREVQPEAGCGVQVINDRPVHGPRGAAPPHKRSPDCSGGPLRRAEKTTAPAFLLRFQPRSRAALVTAPLGEAIVQGGLARNHIC
jgi:hypothetical protein